MNESINQSASPTIVNSAYRPIRDSFPPQMPMMAAGFGLFAAVGMIHYAILDPANNRPTVPREMADAHIWEAPVFPFRPNIFRICCVFVNFVWQIR